MPAPRAPLGEPALERWFGNLLRTGVLLAALVVSVGGVLYLARFGGHPPGYQIFRGEPAELRSVTGIARAAAALQRRALIQFGLLLLIGTPVARVAFAVGAFAWQRDRTYVVVALIVLSVLLYSLSGAYLQAGAAVAAVAWLWVAASGAVQARDASAGEPGAELAVEGFYRLELTRWARFAPDLQYIVNPGGKYSNPLVATLRLMVHF